MKRLALAGCVGVTVVAVVLLSRSDDAAQTVHQEDSQEMRMLREQVATLQKAQSVRREPSLTPKPALSVDDESEPADSAGPSESFPTERPSARQALSEAQMMEALEERFDSESRDKAWADVASPAIHTHLAGSLSGGRLASLECRATLCRTTTVHDNIDQYREFMQAGFIAPTNGGWEGPSLMTLRTPIDAPKLEAVAYFVRPGVELSFANEQGLATAEMNP